MKLPVDVSPDGGEPFRVVVSSRDVYEWEQAGPGKRPRSFGEGGGNMGQLYEVAHISCRRQGLWSGSLEEFRATCDLDPLPEDDEDEDEDRPTPPAR